MAGAMMMDLVTNLLFFDLAVSAGSLPQEVLVATISVSLVAGTDFSFVEGENETTAFRGMISRHAPTSFSTQCTI